jgi:dihydrofolate reductase
MGRNTWAAGRAQGAGDAPISGVSTYVFSRTLSSDALTGATLVRDDAEGFVRKLKRAQGRDICLMGGGLFAQSLLVAGLIDEVGLNIHPLLLGRGVPLFRDAGRRVKLELLECRSIDGGCVLANYRVLPA